MQGLGVTPPGADLAEETVAGLEATGEFDRLTRIAARSLGADSAVFSLVGGGRVYVKSVFGEDRVTPFAPVLPIQDSVAGLVQACGGPLVVTDTATHPLYAHWAAEPPFRSCLAVPVNGPSGAIVGAFGVADAAPRQWTGEEFIILQDLAGVLSHELGACLAASSEEPAGETAARRARAEASSDVLCVLDTDLRLREVGARAFDVWGHAPEELLGRRLESLLAPSDAAALPARLARIATGEPSGDFHSNCLHKDGTHRRVYWSVVWSESDAAFYAITRNEPAPGLSQAPSRKSILVVDDYREIALLVRTALNSAGYANVDVAHGPAKALEMAAVQTYDLVISDLRMRPMNGVDLMSAMREQRDGERVPFIIISGYANLDIVARMKKVGVDGFVAKPFKTADLVRHVRRVLGAVPGRERSTISAA